MNRILYLPIEESARELRSRILIAQEAIRLGFEVVMGQQWLLNENASALPPGAYVLKGNNLGQSRGARNAKTGGHLLATIEEEALGITDERDITPLYNSTTTNFIDLFFAQGEFHRACILSRIPNAADRVHIVGNPRVDLLSPRLTEGARAEAERLRKRHGRFILVNTNYASVNSIWGDALSYHALCVHLNLVAPNSEEDHRSFMDGRRWEQCNFATMKTLIRQLAARDDMPHIIVRPHPSEQLAKWVEGMDDLSRVTVLREGDHLAWSLASDVLLHTSCTTGLEAFLAGQAVISLAPGESDWHGRFLVNRVAPVCATVDEAMERIVPAVTGTCELPRYDFSSLSGESAKHLLIEPNKTSARMIVEALLDGIGGSSGVPARFSQRTPIDLNLQLNSADRQKQKGFVSLDMVQTMSGDLADSVGAHTPIEIDEIGPSVFHLRSARDTA